MGDESPRPLTRIRPRNRDAGKIRYIYFANIRPDYQWGYFAGDVVVAAYAPPERSGTAIVFWDLRTNEKVRKRAAGLRQIRAAGLHCLTVCDERDADDTGKVIHKLALRNAIGVPVETRDCPVDPVFATVTPHYAVIASERHVYVWQFARLQAPNKKKDAVKKAEAELIGLRQAAGREKVLDTEAHRGEGETVGLEDFKPPKDDEPPRDPVTAVAASEKALFVARASGDIHEYALPHVTPKRVHRYRRPRANVSTDVSAFSPRRRRVSTDVSRVLAAAVSPRNVFAGTRARRGSSNRTATARSSPSSTRTAG